ncbi:MAG: sigma-54 interaction domain-containing protein, partial [bacterium]
LLLDEEENLIPAAGRKIDRQSEKDITHISRTVVRSVARSGRPEVSANASDDPRYMSMHSITLHGIKSLMCVPLINRGEAIGALYVDHTLLRNLFTPYDDQFLMTVGNLLAASIDKSRYIDRLETQNVELKRLLHQSFSSGNIIGGSPEMTRVRKLVHRFGLTDQNVLIVGEKGTGKSLIARALHFESPRSNRPFITVDSAHIPAQLIEDALFGHVKGAYSGAYSDSQGLIESASGGTVFLDNVDSIPLDIQAKLVRPLETGEVRRLGSTRTKHVDFKIISASSIPLEQLVEKGRFRLDLYYVLGVLEITLPGLKERGIDVHELASHFLERFAARAGKSIRGFSKEALDAISSYSWPGNVTQLEKCIERAAALCRGEVVTAREIGLDLPAAPRPAPTLGSSRDFAEFSELSSAMIQCSGNVTRAAAVLGMSRRQVQRLLKKHSLLAAQFKPSPGKKTTHPRKTGPRGTHDNAKRRKNLQR